MIARVWPDSYFLLLIAAWGLVILFYIDKRLKHFCQKMAEGWVLFCVLLVSAAATAQESGSTNFIFCEAEEFPVVRPGWQAQNYGADYYAATFGNTFLSRKAFLGAPEQCARTVATLKVEIPWAGRYLALVRYEAAYRFETRFRLVVEQKENKKLDRLYGARENVKVWPFGQRLTNEASWSWGTCENIVWEGHDAWVELEAGPASLSLIAEPQPKPAARRNIDLVMLTSDVEEVRHRIQKEGYLPLDGLLTQAGDLFLKLHNANGTGPISLSVPNGTEHSPYWVHQRHWKPKVISAGAGESTDWIEVGSLLDIGLPSRRRGKKTSLHAEDIQHAQHAALEQQTETQH